MQTAWSRFWTWVAEAISYDENRYVTSLYFHGYKFCQIFGALGISGQQKKNGSIFRYKKNVIEEEKQIIHTNLRWKKRLIG